MKIRKTSSRILSFLLLLSIIASLFSVFAYAATDESVGTAESAEGAGLSVVYNRGFAEGWDYTNGLTPYIEGDVSYGIEYVKMSASRYEYYLNVEVNGESEGYLEIDAGDNLPASGKQFLTFDARAEEDADIVGAVIAMTAGEGSASEMMHLLSYVDGEIYSLGRKVGEADGSWQHFLFEIDYDYEGESEREFLVTLYLDGEAFTSVQSAGKGGFGIGSVLIGAGADEDRTGGSYQLDTVALYHGVDAPTDIPNGNFGTAVDRTLVRNFTILGLGERTDDPNVLSGTPALDRISTSSVSVLYNRHYGEGWDWSNGFNSLSTSKLASNLAELRSDYSFIVNKSENFLNHYLAIEKKNDTLGYVYLAPESNDNSPLIASTSGKVFIEFDMKTSDNNGTMLLTLITDPKSEGDTLVYTDNGELYLLGRKVGTVGGEWLRISIMLDFAGIYRDGSYSAEAHYGSEGGVVYSSYTATTPTVTNLRFGTADKKAGNTGDWFGIDNLAVYWGASTFVNLPSDELGELVNTRLEKDFALSVEGESLTVNEIYNASLTMKVGSSFAYLLGKQVKIYETESGERYGAPVKVDGKVLLPLQSIIDFTGATLIPHDDFKSFEVFLGSTLSYLTLGSTDAIIGGKRVSLAAAPAVVEAGEGMSYVVIGMDDLEAIFPGFYVVWDDCGLLTVTEYKNFINRNMSGAFDTMVSIMRKFLYDYVDGDTVYEMAKEHTNNFDHPYLFANQDKFDELRRVYYAAPGDEDFNAELAGYMQVRVDRADERLGALAELDETGRYLGVKPEKIPVNTNYVTEPGNNGYDVGGRLNLIYRDDYTGALEDIAFAYQVTGNTVYAEFLLDFIGYFCDDELWPHWGPSHFLNVAESVIHMAIAYDWCYDAWMEISPEQTMHIRAKLYEKGGYHGYNSMLTTVCPKEFISAKGYRCYNYHITTNNWNTVCSNGMVVTALALFDIDTNADMDKINNNEALSQMKALVSGDIRSLVNYAMHYYQFDGSYSESVGYWDASTQGYHQMTAVLESVTGSTFGYLDTWGMDRTYYFALSFESSDHYTWPFHDDSASELSTPLMMYYSTASGDSVLGQIRKIQLAQGKTPTIWDAIYYQDADADGDIELPLTFTASKIEAFVARTSWEKGALFTGIMGGYNGEGHAHMDSGNWVYYNKGINWFKDLGSDNYNVYNYWSSYHVYRRSAEGHNLFIMNTSSYEYGMDLQGTGYLTDTLVNEHGSYAIIDQSEVYGGSKMVNYARRGMLITNDNNTVVIQDEVQFKTMTKSYWIAHVNVARSNVMGFVEKIEVSADKKVAYLHGVNRSKGERYTLRVTLITAVLGAGFEVWDAGMSDFALPGTYRPGYSESMGGEPQTSNVGAQRLVVEIKDRTEVKIAVAIELVDRENELETGYKMTDMKKWAPAADTRGYIADAVETRSSHVNGVYTNVSQLQAFEPSTLLGVNMEEAYKKMANIGYIVSKNQNIVNVDYYKELLVTYYDCRATYDGFIKNANAAAATARELVGELFGSR
ncbi:MAG: hypothetical protein IKA64_05505 [Clostridia bacterium]|nr:hypothetical protein [Clostridia bacterium]